MRDSEKSKDPTISSPMRYADLKRQNFPIDPLPLTMLYTSVEKKNKKSKVQELSSTQSFRTTIQDSLSSLTHVIRFHKKIGLE